MWNFNRIDVGGGIVGVGIFHKTFIVFIIEFVIRTATTVHGINHNDYLAQLKVPQCRQDCMDKVSAVRNSQMVHSTKRTSTCSCAIHFYKPFICNSVFFFSEKKYSLIRTSMDRSPLHSIGRQTGDDDANAQTKCENKIKYLYVFVFFQCFSAFYMKLRSEDNIL